MDKHNEWSRTARRARVVDPDTGQLLGYAWNGKLFEEVRELRNEFDAAWEELSKVNDELSRIPYDLELPDGWDFRPEPVKTFKTNNGVRYSAVTQKCTCHGVHITGCPTKRARDINDDRSKTKLNDNEAALKEKIRRQQDTIRSQIDKIAYLESKGKPETVTVVQTQYRDFVADVSNDPEFNMNALDITYNEMTADRQRRNRIALFLLISAAGAVTAYVVLNVLVVAIVAGGCAFAGMAALGGKPNIGLLTENRVEKLKWQRRNLLELERQTQMYFEKSTEAGSTLPITSGNTHTMKES